MLLYLLLATMMTDIDFLFREEFMEYAIDIIYSMVELIMYIGFFSYRKKFLNRIELKTSKTSANLPSALRLTNIHHFDL